MIIEVNSLTDPNNNSYIYEKVVDVIDSIDGVQFTVYKPNHESYRFDYDEYTWHELTPDEAMAHGIYTKENENLKYKLTVDDSGELDSKKLSELDWININGIKFRREK